MPDIDITTMGGEMPRMVAHLLPQSSATIAKNCHFRHDVITPNNVDAKQGKVFSITPGTIFNYHEDAWFAWNGIVDVIRSPVANGDYPPGEQMENQNCEIAGYCWGRGLIVVDFSASSKSWSMKW
ncbi:hypothetical protein ACUTQ5_08430 [Serratia sp. NA_112.1]|uniref:hypothetical protein n=1 Tax=unclassified Serratia (in: enterobacteria) TaxID=2647522 RepID=UPI004046A4EE